MKFILTFLFSVFLLFSAANAEEKTFTINLKDVDIRSLVEQVSTITGENFVVDPQLKGKVTIVSATPLNKQGVHDLFLSVLRVNGYAAIQNGSVTKIVQQANLKQSGMENERTVLSTEEIITSVVSVKNADVNEMVKILKPMVSQYGYLEGSPTSNAIIISDYGDRVKQITKTLARLDSAESDEMEVVSLKFAWVGTLMPLIEKLSPIELGGNGKNRTRLISDERSNSFIIKGASSERAKVRSLIEKLDVNATNASDIQVIPLRHADAKQVAALLRGLVLHEKSDLGAVNPNASPAPVTPVPMGKDLESLQPAAGNAAGASGDGKTFIQADTSLNAIVVRAEPSVMAEIRSVIHQIDVRRAQVLIEAAILEVTSDLTDQLGVQLAAGNGAVSLSEGGTNFPGQGISITDLIVQLGGTGISTIGGNGAIGAFGKRDKFNVLIQALSTVRNGDLLSTPSIMTLDNEEAKIVVGQNVPFRTGSFSTTNSGVTNPFTTIERQDVGITLKVLPQIHEGNLVRLNIAQEVSSVANSVDQAADIVTNKRTIETKVLADNGETIVLGGLMEDSSAQSNSKIPILGDIPLIGDLFSSNQKQRGKRNLLIFLRATVVRDKDSMAGLTEESYKGMDQAKEYNEGLKNISILGKLPKREDDQPQSILPPKHSSPMIGDEVSIKVAPKQEIIQPIPQAAAPAPKPAPAPMAQIAPPPAPVAQIVTPVPVAQAATPVIQLQPAAGTPSKQFSIPELHSGAATEDDSVRLAEPPLPLPTQKPSANNLPPLPTDMDKPATAQ